ncbi:Restriction of telomere capping protein 5 [Lecanora helva]
MGQGQSEEQGAHNVSTEELSHQLALRFARKCFTPLETTHFKDIFRTLADEQDGIRYWKEETLCRFLVIPDSLGAGPLVHQMATYLGAFPFPSLAPSILTVEALLKVVVIMTERYGKVLKNGKADRKKLLFRSLAVFDRRMSSVYEKPSAEVLDSLREGKEESTESAVASPIQNHPAGFSVDQPSNDIEEEEDDDELALAALDSLDAIEVFKYDQRADTKIHHAQIPIDNFRRLLMLLLVIAPLDAQESLSSHAHRFTEKRVPGLQRVADSILWSFTPEQNAGIFYESFNTIIPASLPYLFDGLNPLFEHFLFSKNLDLSRHRRKSSASKSPISPTVPAVSDPPAEPLLPREGEILDLNVLSQLAFFLKGSSLFRRLRPLYMGGDAGFSMGSIEQKVFNWRAPSILLVSGVRLPAGADGARERAFSDTLPTKRFADSSSGNDSSGRVVYGAYLDVPWKHTYKEAIGGQQCLLFQLYPVHDVFKPSTINQEYVTFTKSGISFGNPPPRTRPISGLDAHVQLGPVSLLLDEALEFGVFNHDSTGGGSFHPSQTRKAEWQDRFEIESLEIWGCGGDEEAEKQRAAWAFEEREAAARKSIRMGKDVESDRALLEMAGLIGNHNASGGSMG